jgi:FkbM family methyltransferase
VHFLGFKDGIVFTQRRTIRSEGCVLRMLYNKMKKTYHSVKRAVNIALGRDVWLSPTYSTGTEIHGSDYGGWAIKANSLTSESLVISVGVGEDVSFDLSLINKYGCQVVALDPTERSAQWVAKNVLEDRFIFRQLALAATDGVISLFPPSEAAHVSASCRQSSHTLTDSYVVPCMRLATLMQTEGVTSINVLKLDIEGAEYEVIQDIVQSGLALRIDQLLVEFHHKFSSFFPQDTVDAVEQLLSSGFQIAWVSEAGHEVLFVRSHCRTWGDKHAQAAQKKL